MKIVDTNILLRASLDDDPLQSRIAQNFFLDADKLVVPTYALCELVWVMSRNYKISSPNIRAAIIRLIDSDKVICDDNAISAGLRFLENGDDFADGVIEFEGRRLGGEIFITFDKAAAETIRLQGRPCMVPGAE